MTMLEQRIRQQFYDTSDLLAQVAESMARPLAETVELALATITAGGRLLMVGTGTAHADAVQAAALLCGGGERPRPGLPALALGADAATWAALAQCTGDLSEGLARQVQALGMPGDVLVLFEGHAVPGDVGAPPPSAPVIRAAHDRDMSVVLWSSAPREGDDPAAMSLLTDTDVHLPVRAARLSHRSALYRLGWQYVADAIDMQLLGEQD